MRVVKNINENWKFTLAGKTEVINLPHTWNNIDGQDGENGYYRGKGTYEKILGNAEGFVYLEITGANSVCTVKLNGQTLAVHKGGYSAFRVNLTGKLTKPENLLSVEVSNAPDDEVYPAMADFTFYGGLYRDVNLICFDSAAHFDVTKNGKGVFVHTEKITEKKWNVVVCSEVTAPDDDYKVMVEVLDADGNVAAAEDGKNKFDMTVDNPTLWQGVKNPYLYTVKCTLSAGGKKVDMVLVETAFREINIDGDKGFFLNGKYMKIHGVARHQDRENMGNAITAKEHEEDIRLIKEVGANSVRLAHYQQNDYFYSLCDREGLLVWAEVPVISHYTKKKQANAESQLTELIYEAYNHPSIFCWGIANEITIGGAENCVFEGLTKLNSLAKSLDGTRYTALAEVSMYPTDGKLNGITDILGYNHYFGWYVGTFSMLDEWLKKWRAGSPSKKLCLSEYGAEGIVAYQGDAPAQGDYSEAYQAVYHENYIKRLNEFDWLWGGYVWNMFDFGSAARNEGGVRGRNNKGLVTFDRKIKKDAFYLYKAYWSEEPFLYIAGCRYNERLCGETSIKIYTNMQSVTLNINGKVYSQKGDKVYVFDGLTVEKGENRVTVHAGSCIVDWTLTGVDTLPDSYKMRDCGASMVRNWFISDGGEYNPAYFSINDRIGELLKNAEVRQLINKFAGKKAVRLLYLLRPLKVKTVIKLPFLHIGAEVTDMADRYLQTIKK